MSLYLCCRAKCKVISHGTTCLVSLLSPQCDCQASRLTPSLAASRLSCQISCQMRHHLSPLCAATLLSDPAVVCRSKVQLHALRTRCLCIAIVSAMVGLHLGQPCMSGVTMTLHPLRLCCFLFIIQLHAVTATLTVTLLHCELACGPMLSQRWSTHGVAEFVSCVFEIRRSVLLYHDKVQLARGMSPLQEVWRQEHQHQCRSLQPICSSLSRACTSTSPTSPLPTPPLPTWSCGAGWSPATLPLPLPPLLPAVTLKVCQPCCSCCVCLSCC